MGGKATRSRWACRALRVIGGREEGKVLPKGSGPTKRRLSRPARMAWANSRARGLNVVVDLLSIVTIPGKENRFRESILLLAIL
jgi:hypothetical protein